ncbi:MAG: DEAD/DEAH box helicase [Promethearchaeota archaeon]
MGLLKDHGLMDLYPPQAEAIQGGVLDGDSMLLACPTASGKTLIAELAMLKHILEWNGKVIYLVPLKALASEKKEEFQKYEALGIKTIVSTGDFDTKDQWLKNFDIIICSNEKADSLLRHQVSWMKDISLIVSDEVHLITDPSRGPTLEVVLSKLRQINPEAQLLALSATIKNANEIAEWLNAKLILSEWRPVILREGVYYNGTIEFEDGELEEITATSIKPEKISKRKTTAKKRKKKTRQTIDDPMINLLRDILRKNGQMIVFTNTRKSTMSLASKLARSIPVFLTDENRDVFKSINEEILSAGADTSLRARLAQTVLGGVAFHHAGMDYRHRRIVEAYFKERIIFAICATPTLAAGLNLPARRVVIRDYKRYSFSRVRLGNLVEIPVLEYKQMAGRAGRPKFDTVGEAILISKSEEEKDELMERYIKGDTERITSKLAALSSLRSHLLGIIATGFVDTEGDIYKFLENTFYGHQYAMEEISAIISDVIGFLITEQLIEYKNGKIIATKFGKRVSNLYIDPLSGAIIKNTLQNNKDEIITELGLLHLICSTPNMLQFYLRKKDYGEMMFFVEDNYNEFLIDIPDEYDPDFEFFLSNIKTAKVLLDWIDEVSEEDLAMRYSITSGDLYNLTETAEWLLYATAEIARLFKLKELRKLAETLRTRVKYGVKEEVAELVNIKGIGRKRGRLLYKNGIKTIEDLKTAPIAKLLNIPTLGRSLLRDIFQQIGREFDTSGLTPEEIEKKKPSQTRLTSY